MSKLKSFNWLELSENFNYQPELTLKLDEEKSDFNQDIINEIVLWKVNRYAEIPISTLEKINQIKPEDRRLDAELTITILNELLAVKGIRIAMASTILRFKNRYIYQIIDQRVYRFLLQYWNIEDQLQEKMPQDAESYILYLRVLRDFCHKNGVDFTESDRILYQADKETNSNPIKY